MYKHSSATSSSTLDVDCSPVLTPNFARIHQETTMSSHHLRLSDKVLSSNLAAEEPKRHDEKVAMMPDPSKVTVFMQKSLDQLYSSLVCPLCREMLEAPSTLACGHSFCFSCIENYSRNNTCCPSELQSAVPGNILL
jgi:zinc finger of C3HC4-type, RING